MTNMRVILSCYSNGVHRAEEQPDGTWELDNLLPDLEVTCLAEDPSNNAILYAGTKQSGVYRSTDRGINWKAGGMQGQVVKSLAVNPHQPEVIYAGSKPALLFQSTDAGITWNELKGFREIPNRWWWFSPAEPPDRRPYVIAIALSPTEENVLLAGVEFGAVVRSDDGGATWSRHLGGSLRDCHSLKFHHSKGTWAYEAGGTGGGASISKDGGRTWQKAGKGLAASYGIVCAADPKKPEVWYICVGKSPFNAFGDNPEVYLYRSAGGAGWEPIGWTSHPLNETPTALVTVPGSTGELYAGLKNGAIWQTSDYGDTWRKLPTKLPGIWHSMLVLSHD